MFRELRKWAPNRADRRRGARISERVGRCSTWGSREESLSGGCFNRTRRLSDVALSLVLDTTARRPGLGPRQEYKDQAR